MLNWRGCKVWSPFQAAHKEPQEESTETQQTESDGKEVRIRSDTFQLQSATIDSSTTSLITSEGFGAEILNLLGQDPKAGRVLKYFFKFCNIIEAYQFPTWNIIRLATRSGVAATS